MFILCFFISLYFCFFQKEIYWHIAITSSFFPFILSSFFFSTTIVGWRVGPLTSRLESHTNYRWAKFILATLFSFLFHLLIFFFFFGCFSHSKFPFEVKSHYLRIKIVDCGAHYRRRPWSTILLSYFLSSIISSFSTLFYSLFSLTIKIFIPFTSLFWKSTKTDWLPLCLVGRHPHSRQNCKKLTGRNQRIGG